MHVFGLVSVIAAAGAARARLPTATVAAARAAIAILLIVVMTSLLFCTSFRVVLTGDNGGRAGSSLGTRGNPLAISLKRAQALFARRRGCARSCVALTFTCRTGPTTLAIRP